MRRFVRDLPLVARELLRRRHTPPKREDPEVMTVGGADPVYDHWEVFGRVSAQAPGALG